MGRWTLSSDDVKPATVCSIACLVIAGVISLTLIVLAFLSVCFAFLPAIIIPAVTVPERNFDKKFHGATCEFIGVVAVSGETETKYYPEFNLIRKGESKGIGVPFKKCDGGKECKHHIDGNSKCDWKLKHVSCDNFKTPEGQTDGYVDWNNGEYQVGEVYNCEITNSDMEKVSDELGCTTWSNDMGCAMMDRSKPPNALDDETFWIVMWVFVFGPLSAALVSLLAIIPTVGFFLVCSVFVWVCIMGIVICIKMTKSGVEKADKLKDDCKDMIDNYDKECPQTEPSLPPQNNASNIEEIDISDQV